MTQTADVTRRALLRGALGTAGAAAVCPFSGAAMAAPKTSTTARAAKAGSTTSAAATQRAAGHALVPRGANVAVKVGRATEGRYGLMFKKLPAMAVPDQKLTDLATGMLDRRNELDPSIHDDFDNFDITGGYTFFGQFVDHDMTRDTTPLALAKADPYGTKNFDTPFLDLGSVYGNGPAADPQLYVPGGGGRLRIETPNGIPDLPRDAAGNAYLGDPRNDENIIVAQLHVAFLAFHNKLMDSGLSFAQAQQTLRWTYQRLVVEEFLTRICGRDLVYSILQTAGNRHVGANVRFYKPRNRHKPMMPIEYSGAAYRFGHSMVRPEYEMNDAHTRRIFSPDGNDLRGSRAIPADMHADWSYFFDLPGVERPDGINFSRRMDTQVGEPLHQLPGTVVTDGVVNLAERNLLRGSRLGLPSGQDVAKAMGHKVLTNAQLGLDATWGGKAPLWYYVLKEAEILHGGRQLGPTGGRIIAETIIGILAIDKSSYLNVKGGFDPAVRTVGELLAEAGTGRVIRTMPDDAVEIEDEVEVEVEVEAPHEDEVEVEAPHEDEVEGEVPAAGTTATPAAAVAPTVG